jgi:hypothetical protein
MSDLYELYHLAKALIDPPPPRDQSIPPPQNVPADVSPAPKTTPGHTGDNTQ